MPNQSERVSSARLLQSRVVPSASGMADAALAHAPSRVANELLRRTQYMAEKHAKRGPTAV
jgi:hypothetical protein